MAYISLYIGNYDVIVTLYFDVCIFWYVWKAETHSYTMVPNKHTSGADFLHTSGADFFFKFIGDFQPPLVRRVTSKNCLVRRGLTLVLRRGVATTPNSFAPVLKNAQSGGKITPVTFKFILSPHFSKKTKQTKKQNKTKQKQKKKQNKKKKKTYHLPRR